MHFQKFGSMIGIEQWLERLGGSNRHWQLALSVW